jgi:hypothetical protein
VRETEAVVTQIKEGAVSTGLVRNETKTKFMTRKINLEQDLTTN